MFCKTDSLRIYSRDCSVSTKSHSKHFSQTVHTVGCIHTRTRSACWTYFVLKFAQIFIRKCSCCIRSNSLEHAGKTSLLTFYMSCKHRSSADKDCRNINSGCCHQKSRYVLIAVRNHNKCIELMRHCHSLCRVCNQISCYKRILHSNMSHRNSITDCDCRKYNRCSASHCNTLFYCIYDLIQIHMSWNDFIIRTYDTN